MILTDMRTSFQALTSGTTDSWSTAQIDAYLNNMYAEFLPSDVDGTVHETMWEVTLLADVNPISIPNRIFSFPTGSFWLKDSSSNLSRIGFYDSITKFALAFPDYRVSTNKGAPTAVIRQGKQLFFDRYPDVQYTLVAEARGAASDTLSASGLPFNHAMSVVTAAAWHYLMTQEDETATARIAVMYETFKDRLQVETSGDYKGRTPARSF